jgi:predicted ABC-type ATPase
MPPSVIADFNLTDDVSYLPGNARQLGTDLYPARADGPLSPLLEYLEPARQELATELLNQIDESGAVFWDELVGQLERKPDPTAINQIQKAATPKTVTLMPPVGSSFSVGFSTKTPAGKQWAENKSARLITNIAEDTRANLQDIIGGTTGKGGRQAMMNMLGEVLETAPSLGDLAEFGERLAPSVAGLTLPQHNAVLNRGRTVFAEAVAAGKTTEQALEAVEREASKYGKKLREHRTRVISRTEMMEASNQGKMVAARQAAEAGMFNPQRAGRQWITSSFEVCQICEPLHGKVVAFEGGSFNAAYPRGGNWVVEPRDLPPAHPNCRCTWTVVYDTIVPPSTGLPGQVMAPPDIPAAVREQAWREATRIHKKAFAAQGNITAQVQGTASDIGADLYGLQFNVKEEASLARKIATDFVDETAAFPQRLRTVTEVADEVSDSVRYTMVIDEARYNDDVAAAMRDLRDRGYELTKGPKNYWRQPNAKNPYNGINANFRGPDGVIIEIQFHTPDSLDVKDKIWGYYEKSRQIGIDDIEKKRLVRAAADIADDLPHPKRVTDLEWFPEEPNPYRLATDDDLYNRFGGRLPGGTEDAYTQIDGEYWELRRQLHRDIAADIIGDVPVAEPGEQVVHFMGGGPASGKGTAIRQKLIDFDPDTMVVVDADEIKGHLPEYKVLSKESNTKAAAYVHEESSMLSKEIMAESVQSGRDTMLDGTGDSSIEKLRGKVSSARANSSGERVIADYVTVDTEEAVRRAAARGRRTGRYVPEQVVRDTHSSISRIFPDILDENIFDDIKLWDTNFDPPQLILRKKDGLLEIYDEDAYAKFLRKADYDVVPEIDTMARNTVDGKWIESRVEGVHRPYIEAELAKGGYTESNEVVFMGGGPASGKSSLTNTDTIVLPDRHVLVNADEAKDMIPEYVQIIDQRGDWSVNAAAYVHEESSYMGKQLMSEALDGSNNIVLDGTGDSSYAKLQKKVAEARASSTRVTAEYVTIETEEAVARSAARGARSGRRVPEQVIRDTHAGVSEVFPQAAADDLFDEIRLWDNNVAQGEKPILVYEKIAGESERIVRPDLYDDFLAKNPDFVRPVVDVEDIVDLVDPFGTSANLDQVAVAWEAQAREALEEMIDRDYYKAKRMVTDSGLATLDDARADPTRVRYRVKVDPTDPDNTIAVKAQLEDLRRARGFDDLPELVTDAELDEVLESGGLELLRGDENIQFLEELQSGDFHTGTGHYGDGTYFFSNAGETSAEAGLRTLGDGDGLDTAMDMAAAYSKGWSGDEAGGVLRAALQPDAKTVTGSDLALIEQAMGAQAKEIVEVAADLAIDDASTAAVSALRDIRGRTIDDVLPGHISGRLPSSASIETVGTSLDRLGYTGDDPFGLVALAKQTGDPIDDPAFQSIYRLVVNDKMQGAQGRFKGVKVSRADDGAIATLLGYDAVVDTLISSGDEAYSSQVLLLNRNAVVMADELLDFPEVGRVNDMIRAARVTQAESPEVLDFTLTEIRQRAAGRPPVVDPSALSETIDDLEEFARLINEGQQPVGRVVEATKPEKWFDEVANVEEVIESMPKTGDNRLSWNDPKVSNDPALREIIKTQWPDAGVQQLTVGEMEDAIAEGRTVLYRGFGANERAEVDQFVQEFIDPGDTTYVGQGLFGNGTYASDVEDIADDFATKKFGIGTGSGDWEHGTVVEMVVEADAKIALYEPLEQEMLQAAQPLNSQIEEIKKTTLSVTEAMQRYDDIDIQRGNTILGPDYMRNWPVESMKDIAGADHPWFSEPAVKEAMAELKRLGETVELLYTDVGRYAASQGVDIIEVVKPTLTGYNFSTGVTTTEVPGNYYVILNRSAVGVSVG